MNKKIKNYLISIALMEAFLLYIVREIFEMHVSVTDVSLSLIVFHLIYQKCEAYWKENAKQEERIE